MSYMQDYLDKYGELPDPTEIAERLRALGCQMRDIAKVLGVTETTLQRWLVESPESRQKRRETRRQYRRRKTAEQAAKRWLKWATPSEVARLWGCHPETVRAAIRQGRLEAVNISPDKKRPTYRIYRKFLEP